jgi:enoyl-[acyl-carrier-protein] reductase (NADH)
MGRLEGKIAVITGSNSGIGLASAKRFVAEGAHVYITGRRQEELGKAVQAIGTGVTAVQSDVSDLEDLDRLFTKVRSDRGRIDVLFANAGLGAREPLGKITESSFDLVFGVNVKGTLFTVQKGLPLMRDGGSIILTGSTTGSMGTPAFSIYGASKSDPQSCPQLGAGPQRYWNPRERSVARRHGNAWPAQRLGENGPEGRHGRRPDRADSARTDGRPGRYRRRRTLSGV